MSAGKRKQPSSTARGYGQAHRKLRERWARRVALGDISCARCGLPIIPGTPWDLGHLDGTGKQIYSGPEHRHCSRATEHHGVKQNRQPHRYSRRW